MGELLTAFHFSEPAWLWALLLYLPVAAWLLLFRRLAGNNDRIQRYADEHLLPHLLGRSTASTHTQWKRYARWAGLWTLLVLAMAGPRWDFTDVQLFRPGTNLLILMDISQSMNVTDVQPTRLARARQEVDDLLSQAGATPLVFPVLEILDPSDPSALTPLIERLDDFDWAIFISPNAVEKAVNLIHARRDLPGTLKLATIGKGSAKALQKMIHRPPDLCPKDQFNSEALLAMPELQNVRGQRIVIFRGDGGREYLADTLRARGAHVEYANTYRRARPNADIDQLQRQWARDGIDVITISSGDGLRNLFDMVGNLAQNWLRQTQLVVVNERLVGLVNELGFARPPLVANEASDEAIVDAICRWRKTKNQHKNQESRNPV